MHFVMQVEVDCAYSVLWETRLKLFPQTLHHRQEFEFVIVGWKGIISD